MRFKVVPRPIQSAAPKPEVITLEKIVEVPGPVQYVDREVIKHVHVHSEPKVVYVDKPYAVEKEVIKIIHVDREVIKEIPAEPIYVDREVKVEVPVEVLKEVFMDRIRVVEKIKVPPALVAALVVEALVIIYLLV